MLESQPRVPPCCIPRPHVGYADVDGSSLILFARCTAHKAPHHAAHCFTWLLPRFSASHMLCDLYCEIRFRSSVSVTVCVSDVPLRLVMSTLLTFKCSLLQASLRRTHVFNPWMAALFGEKVMAPVGVHGIPLETQNLGCISMIARRSSSSRSRLFTRRLRLRDVHNVLLRRKVQSQVPQYVETQSEWRAPETVLIVHRMFWARSSKVATLG